MKTLALVLLLSSSVFADVSVIDNKKTLTVDCAKDSHASIAGNHNMLVLKGKCTAVSVLGNNNAIKAESVTQIDVTGNDNSVTAAAADTISVTGDRNSVTCPKGIANPKPSVTDTGKSNKIATK